jgi:hypothetical protein
MLAVLPERHWCVQSGETAMPPHLADRLAAGVQAGRVPDMRGAMLRVFLTAMLAATAVPALANDSVAELGTGGVVLSRSDSIAMESEDLFLSRDKVTVDYVFRNSSDKDIDTIVAFPMPDIEGNPNVIPSIPDDRTISSISMRRWRASRWRRNWSSAPSPPGSMSAPT